MTMTNHSSPHYRNCNICEAICGIEITVQPDNRLTFAVTKTIRSAAATSARRPLPYKIFTSTKTGSNIRCAALANGWQRIGWDEAFDEVAQNLKRIQANAWPEFRRYVSR